MSDEATFMFIVSIWKYQWYYTTKKTWDFYQISEIKILKYAMLFTKTLVRMHKLKTNSRVLTILSAQLLPVPVQLDPKLEIIVDEDLDVLTKFFLENWTKSDHILLDGLFFFMTLTFGDSPYKKLSETKLSTMQLEMHTNGDEANNIQYFRRKFTNDEDECYGAIPRANIKGKFKYQPFDLFMVKFNFRF